MRQGRSYGYGAGQCGFGFGFGHPAGVGYAHTQGLTVYGLRAVFRTLGIEGAVNLMIKRSVLVCMEQGDLVERLAKDLESVGAEML